MSQMTKIHPKYYPVTPVDIKVDICSEPVLAKISIPLPGWVVPLSVFVHLQVVNTIPIHVVVEGYAGWPTVFQGWCVEAVNKNKLDILSQKILILVLRKIIIQYIIITWSQHSSPLAQKLLYRCFILVESLCRRNLSMIVIIKQNIVGLIYICQNWYHALLAATFLCTIEFQ